MKHEAQDILKAAYSTFELVGSKDYAQSKSNTFLTRCGATLDDGPKQLIDGETVRGVSRSMFDTDLEAAFLSELQQLSMEREK